MEEPPSSILQPRGHARNVVAGAVTNGKNAVHLLSCTNCRKRKVKCSKTNPCSACDRSSLTCVFPNRARLPRGRTGGSKTTNVELLRRVNKLEELLDKASGETSIDSAQPLVPLSREAPADSSHNFDPKPSRTSEDLTIRHRIQDKALDRYMGSNFWKSLTYEIESLRHTLSDRSDDEDNSPLPLESDCSNSPSIRSSRVWGGDLPRPGLLLWHPSSSQMLVLYTFYLNNFDPLFKVLHVPTLKIYVDDASNHIENIQNKKSTEALLFAMYYAAVTAMTSAQCMSHLQEDKDVLLDRYRTATEIALANANILLSSDLTTLQALVIFLITVRCHDDSQFMWTLTAVAIRLAHSLRLHQEDLNSSLSPHTRELHRRLWVHICILDIHSAEDRGSDPMIHEATFTTKKPLNICDADLDPANMQVLSDRVGYTEMTFGLICNELSMVARRFTFTRQPAQDRDKVQAGMKIEEKISLISECEQYLRQEYFIHCDNTNPIAWVAVMVARLILARMWLAVYHPLQPEQRFHVYPMLTRERLMQISVSILEDAHRLEHEPSVAQWRWFFSCWVQWHALAVALAELCLHNRGPLVERAWAIIDKVYEPWASHIADSRRGMLWRPIQKLMNKALANRRTCASADPSSPAYPTSNSGSLSPEGPSLLHNLHTPDISHAPSETSPNAEVALHDLVINHQIDKHQPSLAGVDPHPGLPDLPTQQHFSALFPHQATPDLSSPQTVSTYGPHQTLPVFTPSASHGESLDTINWAEWDAFLQEFELEQHPGPGDQVSNDLKPLGRLWLP